MIHRSIHNTSIQRTLANGTHNRPRRRKTSGEPNKNYTQRQNATAAAATYYCGPSWLLVDAAANVVVHVVVATVAAARDCHRRCQHLISIG